MNYFKTGLLLAAMTGLFMMVGGMLGGTGGMMIAFILALVMNLFAFWNSDKIVLSQYGATPIDDSGHPIVEMVRSLTTKAGMPMPKVYVLDQEQPNAFATGRNPENAAVAITTGLLRLLNKDEIMGVMAHELAHIRNRDTLIMTITATLAGAISSLTNFFSFLPFFAGQSQNGEDRPHPLLGLILMIVAPLVAMIVQMSISRAREYEADRVGALISGKPLALASALKRIEESVRGYGIHNPVAENKPATAHMFIINPLLGGLSGLFSTHPATDKRIAALHQLQQDPEFIKEMGAYHSPISRPTSHQFTNPWG